MSKKTGRRGAGVLVSLLCFCLVPASQAKPPDLPLEQGFSCPENDARECEQDCDQQARRMFEMAERCRRDGKREQARTCYEEAHLLSPTSRHGRLAIQRLVELEAIDDASEEQEEPSAPAERPLLKLHALPLGLVEQVY